MGVISYGFWKRCFAGDPGRPVYLRLTQSLDLLGSVFLSGQNSGVAGGDPARKESRVDPNLALQYE
jgi:hypothetical protein